MKFNDNTIDYNSIPNSKPAGAASVSGQIFDLNNKFWELEEGDTPSTLVNAVEIDWNGAVLPNNDPETAGDLTISTTGELLKTINDMQKEIYVLTAAVIALSEKVNTQ